MWKAELNNALETKVGKFATISNGDLVRRATVWGGESVPIKTGPMESVREQDERAHLARSQSTRALGLRADVPVGVDSFRVDSFRESVATLSNMPHSAASTMTLFEDFEAGLGPLAESTPHDDQKKTNQPTSRKAPPRNPLPTTHTRRSSIVYIKSDDSVSPTNPIAPSRSFSRAVRQLVPKRNILQRKPSSSDTTKPSSPSGGLRPLSLLQDRNTNIMVSPSGTRPLLLGKKKQQLKTIRDDENVDPSSRNKNIKQLQLARSETSKQRAVLRASEVLPDVVVRPPSTGEQLGLVYGYAC